MVAPRLTAAVLWDIDGTLLTSGGQVGRAFLDAVEHVAGVRPDLALPTLTDFPIDALRTGIPL